jgi:1-acyl-sn-glycerol-3-phosphate acyltransferase
MARGVLGNDPFKRGAAVPAEPEPQRTQVAEARPEPKKKSPAKAAATKKAAKPKPPGDPRARVRATPEAKRRPQAAAPEVERQQVAVAARSARAEAAPRRIDRAEPAVAAAPDESLRARAVGALVLGRNLVAQASIPGSLSNALGAAAGLWRALQTGIGTAGSTELDDYGRDAALARDLHPLGDFVYQRYFRVKVEGAERVPGGAAILVANHSGALPLDGPVLHAALGRERADLPDARWLVEDQIFLTPFVGTLLNRLGAVRACPQNALRLLDEGRPVIVFPEGIQGIGKPFRDRYRLMRFGRGGFVKIALQTRAPIIPVAILGAEESMPLFGRLPGKSLGLPYLPLTPPPLPARWIIRFGEPIRVDEHPRDAQDDVALIHRLNERTRESVQGMLDSMLQARRGVFA